MFLSAIWSGIAHQQLYHKRLLPVIPRCWDAWLGCATEHSRRLAPHPGIPQEPSSQCFYCVKYGRVNWPWMCALLPPPSPIQWNRDWIDYSVTFPMQLKDYGKIRLALVNLSRMWSSWSSKMALRFIRPIGQQRAPVPREIAFGSCSDFVVLCQMNQPHDSSLACVSPSHLKLPHVPMLWCIASYHRSEPTLFLPHRTYLRSSEICSCAVGIIRNANRNWQPALEAKDKFCLIPDVAFWLLPFDFFFIFFLLFLSKGFDW